MLRALRHPSTGRSTPPGDDRPRGSLYRTVPDTNLNDRVVIIVDDILDEGYTLQELVAYCEAKGAKKVLSAVLLKKKLNSAPVNIVPDFLGMEVVDRYVFGWGMDYKGYLRNQSSIYAIAESEDA